MTRAAPIRADATCADRFDPLAPGCLEGGVLMTIHRLSQGGADRVTMLLANGLVAAGIPTSILVLRTGGEGERTLRDILDPGVAVHHAGAPMGSRHLELLRGYRRVRRQIRRTRPGVVLASSSNMGLVTGLVARRAARGESRFIMKLTNPVIRPRDDTPLKRFYRRRLYQFIFGSYDRILVLTDAETERLRGMFPRVADRFETVANPYVTPAMFATGGRDAASDAPRILALARMMPQKRLDRLLAAFARVETPAARLIVLGDGPCRARLEQQARALGIEDRLEMPGFVDDVVPWLRAADLFVLSSDYEGLPAAILEALACNVPVVSTDCFDGGHALLGGAARCAIVPREDVGGFAKAIDDSLAAMATPIDLRPLALPYAFDVAIAAHVDVVRCLLSGQGGRVVAAGDVGASRSGRVVPK